MSSLKATSEEIRQYVITRIKECKKLTLFVFDEVQSSNPEIFQGLNDILDERGSITIDPKTNERLNTSNVFYNYYLFIFIRVFLYLSLILLKVF